MDTNQEITIDAEVVAIELVRDLASIGSVTYAPRLNGFAVFEDDVMFGFVETNGTIYLRTSPRSGAEYQALGATKHPEMPYWSLPAIALADFLALRQFAYEAADNAHIAASFGIDDVDPAVELVLMNTPFFGKLAALAVLAA